MARPAKVRCICAKPKNLGFIPLDGSLNQQQVVITFDEYEVIRLLDYVGMSQVECAERMHVSRTTVTRLYESARGKIADAFVNGKQIVFNGGDVVVCEKERPECAGEKFCCHRLKKEEFGLAETERQQ